MHDAFAGEGDVYRVTREQARAGLADIAAGTLFDPGVTMGRPETFQILQQLAGMYAKAAPDAPSTLAAVFPASLRPTGPVTNAGLLNWLYVEHPLVPDLSINPAYTSLAAMADLDAGGPVPGPWEWYWPQRLTLDLSAADAFTRTPATDVLGLRLRPNAATRSRCTSCSIWRRHTYGGSAGRSRCRMRPTRRRRR